MKKRITGLLAALLLLSCSACAPQAGQSSPSTETAGSGSSAASSPAAEEPSATPDASIDAAADTTATPEAATRPVAVIVDNHIGTRPNSGLSAADIVFETDVWGGISRFIAVYSNYETMPTVGPVREMFTSLVQFVLPAQPLIVSDCISKPSAEIIEQYDYASSVLDETYDSRALFIDEERAKTLSLEYCRYTDGAHIAAAAQAEETAATDTSPQPLFLFEETGSGGAGEFPVATAISIPFSEPYQSQFAFDGGTGRYLMSRSNVDGEFEAAMDGGTNGQLAFDNVLVLFAAVEEVEPTEGDVQADNLRYKLDHGGDGYYFHGGTVEAATWEKADPLDRFHIYPAEGRGELALASGTTYVGVMDSGRMANFTYDNGEDD